MQVTFIWIVIYAIAAILGLAITMLPTIIYLKKFKNKSTENKIIFGLLNFFLACTIIVWIGMLIYVLIVDADDKKPIQESEPL